MKRRGRVPEFASLIDTGLVEGFAYAIWFTGDRRRRREQTRHSEFTKKPRGMAWSDNYCRRFMRWPSCDFGGVLPGLRLACCSSIQMMEPCSAQTLNPPPSVTFLVTRINQIDGFEQQPMAAG